MNLINYIKTQFNTLWKSFDLRKFMYIVLINLFSLGLLAVFWKLFERMMFALSDQAQSLGLTDKLRNVNVANSVMLDSTFRSIGLKMIWFSIFIIIGSFLIWVISQLTVWLVITGNNLWKKGFGKINYAYFKFLLLNLIWILIWFIPLMFIMVLIYHGASANLDDGAKLIMYLFVSFVMGIYLYVTTICFYNFAKSQKIFKSIGLGFSIAVVKIGHFIIPLLISTISLSLLGLLIYPLSLIFPDILTKWIYLVLFLSQSAWMSLFFAKVIAKIQQNDSKFGIEQKKIIKRGKK